jgi:outer membrane protein OmpA-like peptidoglycan-associated protein
MAQITTEQMTVYYESNVHELNKDQQIRIIDFLDKPNVEKIELYGFADTLGNFAANQKISEQRVNGVKEHILSWYDNVLIITKASGEKQWQGTQFDNQRRVEIVVTYDPTDPVEEEKITPPSPPKDTSEIVIPTPDLSQRKVFYETFATSDRIVIENLLFEPGTTNFLHDKTPNELFYLADLMDSIPTLEIHIEGHVCCVNDKKLSKNRAKTVYSFLKFNGIKGKRMTYAGYSNSQPRVEELTKEDQKLNRRVEIVITQR